MVIAIETTSETSLINALRFFQIPQDSRPHHPTASGVQPDFRQMHLG